MRPGLPEGTRSRTLAAGILLPLAALAAFRVLWAGPQSDLLAMRRVELEQRRAEVVRARRAASRLPGLEAEVERLRGLLEALRRTVPGEREASALLRRLQGIAAHSRLTMQSFTLDATSAREGYEEWPVRLELTGGFHEFATFLDEVSRLPQVVTIGHLSIRALASGTPTATITATCSATTYVLRELAGDGDTSGGGERLRR